LKKPLIFNFLILFGAVFCHAQITFQRTYGDTSAYFNANSVKQTNDGGYIFCGYKYISAPPQKSFVYLIKTDSNGDTLWTKQYGDGTRTYKGNDISLTSDGGYIITGQGNYQYGSNCCAEIYFIKTDENGDTIWTRAIKPIVVPYTHLLEGNLIKEINGEYIAYGLITDASVSQNYLVKLKNNGDTIWTKSYGTPYGSSISDFTVTPDGGFALLTQRQDLILIRTDSLGDTLWSKSYGNDTSGFYPISILQNADSGFIITAVKSDTISSSQLVLIKTDMFGDTLWCKSYNGLIPSPWVAANLTSDGGLIITGYDGNCFLIRTTQNGNVVFAKSFGMPYTDIGYSVIQTSDGGFITGGYTNLNSLQGLQLMYIIKTDSNGYSGCNESDLNVTSFNPFIRIGNRAVSTYHANTIVHYLPITVSGGTGTNTLCSTVDVNTADSPLDLFKIIPNPTHSYFTISTTVINTHLKIFDITGRLVHAQIINQKSEIINTRLSPGVYFVSVTDGEKVFTEKLVIE
jgi:hypothetical protein